MSRHKLIKSMNLDDELDDFDGGSNFGDEVEGGEEGMCGILNTYQSANILLELSAEDKGAIAP